MSIQGIGVIANVESESIAARAGLRSGDHIVMVNGRSPRDVVDFQFYAAEEEVEFLVSRGDERLTIKFQRPYGEDLGIAFTEDLFDGIRRCNNRCEFCFLHQMPPNLRPSLCVNDDDYRLSFLYGNFITLTNLTEADWERLAEQRLSPLYVSVHATDPELRRRLLRNFAAPDICEQIRRLGTLGIEVHAQVVVISGVNDGPALVQTVNELAALYPTVQSIALVPVGLTRYHPRDLRALTPREAAFIVDHFSSVQRRFRRTHGLGLLYFSDEFYLLAGLPMPPSKEYDGYPQLKNGVGLTRLLLDDWDKAQEELRGVRVPYSCMTLVCGALIAPILTQLAVECSDLIGAQVRVLPVINQALGETVTVSGLLFGKDVVSALQAQALGQVVILPRVMFDAAGERTLDDLTVDVLAERVNARVALADMLSEVAYL
ncbi:MAG: DUF512 domain-containing protein [Chloroflexi bacterium]|nr:DUF512 domain-containing protein [Chloroflexota bacterium]